MVENCCQPSIPERKGLCPVCRQKGKKISQITLEHLIEPSLIPEIGSQQSFFCENSLCEVVYFSSPEERIFSKAHLRVRVGIKEMRDPIPVCYCFGYERKTIWDEIARTGKSEIPDKIRTEIQAGNCTCEIKNPSGDCCLGDVILAVKKS